MPTLLSWRYLQTNISKNITSTRKDHGGGHNQEGQFHFILLLSVRLGKSSEVNELAVTFASELFV